LLREAPFAVFFVFGSNGVQVRGGQHNFRDFPLNIVLKTGRVTALGDLGEKEKRRQGEEEKRRQGDKEKEV
jgi:hypothetical protein